MVAAIAFWGWQNSEKAVDWLDAKPTDTVGPTPAAANLAQMFSTDDYPMEAIRREEQGTVAFRLNVNRRGGVSECAITSSSGSAALDKQTCQILTQRASFEPARNTHGNRVDGTYTGRIRWELPEE